MYFGRKAAYVENNRSRSHQGGPRLRREGREETRPRPRNPRTRHGSKLPRNRLRFAGDPYPDREEGRKTRRPGRNPRGGAELAAARTVRTGVAALPGRNPRRGGGDPRSSRNRGGAETPRWNRPRVRFLARADARQHPQGAGHQAGGRKDAGVRRLRGRPSRRRDRRGAGA